jgi:hypothetical protein
MMPLYERRYVLSSLQTIIRLFDFCLAECFSRGISAGIAVTVNPLKTFDGQKSLYGYHELEQQVPVLPVVPGRMAEQDTTEIRSLACGTSFGSLPHHDL